MRSQGCSWGGQAPGPLCLGQVTLDSITRLSPRARCGCPASAWASVGVGSPMAPCLESGMRTLLTLVTIDAALASLLLGEKGKKDEEKAGQKRLSLRWLQLSPGPPGWRQGEAFRTEFGFSCMKLNYLYLDLKMPTYGNAIQLILSKQPTDLFSSGTSGPDPTTVYVDLKC